MIFLANLNETNITNGLSVGGGITVDDLGIKRASSLLDFYLGPAEEIPAGSDLDNYVTPGVYDIPSGNVIEILNLPEGFEGGGKLFVIQTSYFSALHVDIYVQLLFSGTYIYYRSRMGGLPTQWSTIAVTSQLPSGTPQQQREALGMNKVLWTGNWSSGSIEVPELSTYSVIALSIHDNFARIICTKNGNVFRGIGGCAWTGGESGSIYFFNGTISGDTLTMVGSCGGNYVTNTGAVSAQGITAVIGIC